jgi:hypothetical protein
MTIPFLAMLSCLLLASNNPGSLHGILAVNTTAIQSWGFLVGAYPGPHRPVDLWDRGPSKMYWFRKTVVQYGSTDTTHQHPEQSSQASPDELRQLETLTREIRPKQGDWWLIFLAATVPLLVSFILAFITSFNTPRVGLACRSLTHLLYLTTQLAQMLLWMCWEVVIVKDQSRAEARSSHALYGAYTALRVLLGVVSAFISIGGTLMQLIGVYRNCLCKVSRVPQFGQIALVFVRN